MQPASRLTHHEFDPQVLVLFDAYVHGDIDRRGFLQRAGQILGGAAALSALGALSPRFAAAQQVPPPLIRQLKPGGRMVIPVGGGFALQHLMLVEKDEGGRVRTRQTLPVRFVPLTGGS